jgi:hypothetical protein
MIGMEVHLAPDGSFKLSGDVMSFSKLEISSHQIPNPQTHPSGSGCSRPPAAARTGLTKSE